MTGPLPFQIRTVRGRVCVSGGDVVAPLTVGEAEALKDLLARHANQPREVISSQINAYPLLNIHLPGIATLINPVQAGELAQMLEAAIAESSTTPSPPCGG